MTRFRKTKMRQALLPGIFLGTLLLSAAGAGWIAPYSPHAEAREYAYHPPAKIHFRNEQGGISLFRPYVYETRRVFDSFRRRHYVEKPGRKFYVTFFKGCLFTVPEPAKAYLLGSVPRGCDIFS